MSKVLQPLLALAMSLSGTKAKAQSESRHRERNFKYRKIMSYIMLAFFITIISWFIPSSKSKVSFHVNYSTDLSSTAQLFYDIGSGYTEEDSAIAEITDKKVDFRIESDIVKKISVLRFDPVSEQQDDFSIDEIQVQYRGKNILVYSPDELRKYVDSVENANIDDKDMKLTDVQDDSNIYFSADLASLIKTGVEHIDIAQRIFRSFTVFLMIVVAFLFIANAICRSEGIKKALKNFIEKNRLQEKGLFRYIVLIVSNIFVIVITILYTVKDFLIENFSGLSFSEIVFHLKVPMEGTSTDMFSEYFKSKTVVLVVTVVCLAAVDVCILKIKKVLFNRLTYIAFLGCSLAVFIGGGVICLKQLGVSDYIKSQMQSSKFIEDNYVKPDTVSLAFPEKKRNLIYIFMESMESTFISKTQGGAMEYDIIPELTKLAQNNTNFSEDDMTGGSYATYGTTWTVGAMVAQTSGLPLLLPIDGNSYGDYTAFLPGAVSLGDILKNEGYNQEIMVGSDISFGGRGLYFSQHGSYDLWDYSTAVNEGKIDSDYRVWWGYEDKKLYEYAKEEVTKLADKDEPFNFTMLTVDTHHIGGYKCDICGDKYDVQYENVLACASSQVYEFVKWLKTQDFYENTTIVISGDHPTMDNVYMDSYYDGSKERRVYNCLINSAVDTSKNKNRKFTSMDLFPTTLAAIGVQIEGERLGLGTNLYSDMQTLSEEYGYEYIDNELAKNSKFYNKQILGE